jgi:hypothetical protein
LERNLNTVRQRIADAAGRADRDAEEVTLVAVTKTVPAEVVNALYELGVRDFGENRAQVGVPKAHACPLPEARWHFIGHLQRNKAKDVFPAFAMLHSLDSERLADQVQKVAEAGGFMVPVLVEVNTGGEEAKYGLTAETTPALLARCRELPNLDPLGLMTMAPWEEDPEATRPCFAALRALRDRCEDELDWPLPELSMGMSNDFEMAVEEGATLVRVGSALFDGVA